MMDSWALPGVKTPFSRHFVGIPRGEGRARYTKNHFQRIFLASKRKRKGEINVYKDFLAFLFVLFAFWVRFILGSGNSSEGDGFLILLLFSALEIDMTDRSFTHNSN
ncbi:hypothetical protein OIU79_005949 [Salix purpurea]|uniref:Transmembrane protein n=1 Tax=Salix purpurea TaxID=77065 RepID=A0A9Q0Z1P0_SALPP|nr:hypothetical protein OIU79_005949 [Salix purpurea]